MFKAFQQRQPFYYTSSQVKGCDDKKEMKIHIVTSVWAKSHQTTIDYIN